MKQIDRLIFLQGNACFFCGKGIPKGEASIEHLVAKANGGENSDGNCAVVCKSANEALGHLTIKAKIQVVLNQRGDFVCPSKVNDEVVIEASIDPISSADEQFKIFAERFRKYDKNRPKTMSALKSVTHAIFKNKLEKEEVAFVIAMLLTKGYVNQDENNLTYAMPW